jgi:hypothetical protein
MGELSAGWSLVRDMSGLREMDRSTRDQTCRKPAGFVGRVPYCAVSLISHNWRALIRAISSENALHAGYIRGEAIRLAGTK